MSELPVTPLGGALRYAEEGIRVFPLAQRGKVPLLAGGRGCHDATTNLDQIREWWSRAPDANVGVATGSGLLVVDLDGDPACTTFAHLCDEHGGLVPTRMVSTGRQSGYHLWYRASGAACRNSTGANGGIAPGIDTRGAGGYVVAPPSIHPSGRAYESDWTEIADAPAWILDRLTRVQTASAVRTAPMRTASSTTRYGRAALEREAERVRTTKEGGRNEQLSISTYALARLEAGGEIAPGDIEDVLLAAAMAAGLTQRASIATIGSGLKRGRKKPRCAPERPAIHRRSSELPDGPAKRALEEIIRHAKACARDGDHASVHAVLEALGADSSSARRGNSDALGETIRLAHAVAARRDGKQLGAALRLIAGKATA